MSMEEAELRIESWMTDEKNFSPDLKSLVVKQ
jgi:hypothetical protein